MVPFECPECSATELEIERSIELGANNRSDEVAIQTLACAACGFEAVAIYEESRRGALDGESVDHVGYRLAPPSRAALKAALATCPRPTDPRCRCATHRELRSDESGRWEALLDVAPRFRMRLAR